MTYVFDASAPVLDQSAVLGIGDLGPNGQTWSLAGPSFAGGVLYHHSSKEVVAIGSKPAPGALTRARTSRTPAVPASA